MTACAGGTVCTVLNDYYSQCLPGTAASTTVSSTSHTTSTTATSTTVPAPSPSGFVTTSGTEFRLNGAKFTVFGYVAYISDMM